MTKVNDLFNKELKVINIGLQSFSEDLRKQEVKAVHVDWRPTAGGNKKMQDLLSKLK